MIPMSDDNERTYFLDAEDEAESRRAESLRRIRSRTDARNDEEIRRHLANPQGDEVLPTDADDPHNFGAK